MIKKSQQYIKITYNNGINTLVIPPRYIINIDGSFSADFSQNVELLTGVAQPNTARIEIAKPTDFPGLTTFLSRSFDWRMTKAELFYSDTGGAQFMKVSEGLLFVRSETNTSVTFTLRGYLDLLNISLVESPVFKNRKTATSIPTGTTDADKAQKLLTQNPYILQGVNVGTINALLWSIGGRPHKYKSLYDNQYSSVIGEYPKFYFDCDVSVMNPEWTWFNYENLLDDLNSLCKASGGILRQDSDGVIRFENIYNFNKVFSGITLTDSSYSSLDLGEFGTEPYSRIVTSYTPRFLSSAQIIFSEKFSENLAYQQSLTRRINFDKPVWKILNTVMSGQLSDFVVSSGLVEINDSSQVQTTDIFGIQRAVKFKISPHTTFAVARYIPSGVSGTFTQVLDNNVVASQSATVQIENSVVSDSSSLYIGDVKIYGRSLEAGGQQRYVLQVRPYSSISGYKEFTIPDNPYVQSDIHAQRLSQVTKYLMENNRMQVSIQDVPFISGLALGQIIRINSVVNELNEYFRVTSIEHVDAFSRMNINAISISGLYTQGNLFIVGTTYANNAVRVLSF